MIVFFYKNKRNRQKLTQTDNRQQIMNFRICPLIFVVGVFALLDVTRGYDIGVGRADVTGPIVEVTLMGYGRFDQKGTGLHLRQYSRAFIIGEKTNRFVFVSVDVGMMSDGVRIQVLKNLNKKFGNLYNKNNVMISGTHTHSAVGGYLMHTFFDIPTGGFSRATFDALVAGIVKSVERAHENLQDGKVYFGTTTVLGVSVNRSPTSYLENPKEERDRYKYDTDKELVQLKFVNKKKQLIGAINWYPVHGTSLNYTNTLVSSDNVGLACLKMEQMMSKNKLHGQGEFVAAFASSNLGDVSPNTDGPKCHESGTQCDKYSKCADFFEECYALGTKDNMYDSSDDVATKLNAAAMALLNAKGEEIKGPIQGIHQYVDMSKATAVVFNPKTNRTEKVRGCVPAMGYSAGAGTTDGQFLPFLRQGMKNTTWWLDAITKFVSKPTKEDIECHAPKPILLATGHMEYPFEWQPKIISTQLGRLGQVAIACVPGEFTTMSGRRMKDSLKNAWSPLNKVVIAGLCNTYSDYISTFEEYQAQRYEAASTLYGPHTLSIHLEQYNKLGKALKENKTLEPGPEPKGLDPDNMLSTIPPVILDTPKYSFKFGDVLVEPLDLILSVPGLNVKTTFVGANPRNNLRLDDTFLLVEKKTSKGWVPEATDSDPRTTFRWRRTNVINGTSEVDIEWNPWDVKRVEKYRIRYFGDAKGKDGKITPFEGVTREFTITQS